MTVERWWRLLSMPIVAAVFMTLILAATSLLLMADREAQRDAQRRVIEAEEPSRTDLYMVNGTDVWRDEEYRVVWIEPAGGARPVLPPGMGGLPEPGEAVVSPALDRLASQNPGLSARYPNRSVLGPQGVRSGDELFAYVRVREGRTLAQSALALRAGGFGSAPGDGRPNPRPPDPGNIEPLGLVSTTPAVAGTLGFLVAPGLVVLITGLSIASDPGCVLFRRSAAGASRRRAALLRVLGPPVLASPGLVLAAVFCGTISSRLERVPLIAHGVVRGDLQIPWWLVAAELLAGLVLTALLAAPVAALADVRRRVATKPSTPFRETVSLARRIPPSLPLAALALGYVMVGPDPGLVFVLALVVCVPLVLPGALREAGSQLVRFGSTRASIEGHGIRSDPYPIARAFAGATACMILALTCVGYAALAPLNEESLPSTAAGAQAVLVNWADPHPDDAARLADDLDGALVVPFRLEEHAHGAHALIIGGTCRQIAAHLSGPSCEARSPFGLPEATKLELADGLAPAAGSTDTEIVLAPRDEIAASGNLAVIEDRPLDDLEGRVRTASVRALPAPYVYSRLTTALYMTPAIEWIVCGSAIVTAVLAIGCFFSAIGRYLKACERGTSNARVDPGDPASSGLRKFAVSFGTAVVAGFVAGLMSCTMLIAGSGASMPWRGIGIVSIVTVAAGLVAAASVEIGREHV